MFGYCIRCRVTGCALKWFQLYLCGQTQHVRLGLTKSVAAQHQQDGAALVCHCTASKSATVQPASCWTSPGQSCINSLWPGYINADLSGRTQVLKITASCFAALRQLRTVRWCLPLAAYKLLIVTLVLGRLDYGNATLSGLPDYQFHRLQSVINAAARSIFNLRWSDHIAPALIELNWVSAVDRVNFKVATLVFRCLHDLAPPYLSSSLHRVSDMDSRRRLKSSADTDILLVPRSWLVTVGDRSFPITGPRTWNNLPASIRSARSLLSFKRQLKTCLFSRPYTWHCFS